MPSGYTSDIYDGKPISLKEFAIKCAHAFEALIMLRDDGLDAPVPDSFDAGDYHQKRLKEANEALKEAETMTDGEASVLANQAFDAAMESYRQQQENTRAMADRYNAMLARVAAWTPPTSEHVGLKKFMLEQLTDSKHHDCYEHYIPVRVFGPVFKANAIERARRDIVYHETEHAKEVKRAQERTDWVRALKASL